MTVECHRLTDRRDVRAGIDLWNDCHPEFAIDDRLVEQNVYAPFDVLDVHAWGCVEGDETTNTADVATDMTGFALAKTLTRPVDGYAGPERGWISLLGVRPEADDPREVGRALLHAAEDELAATGVETVRFGGDPQNFLAGLPTELADEYGEILSAAGYEQTGTVYDLARDVSTFERPDRVEQTDTDELHVERVAPGGTSELTAFLDDQFPGRWHYEAVNIARRPGGVADYWLLRYRDEVVGFARTNAPSSAYRGSNANWGWRLGQDHCGLGPVGIHRDYRGRGWGLFLLAEVVESLRATGFDHVVIDWTDLTDYYAKLGFTPWLEYDVRRTEL